MSEQKSHHREKKYITINLAAEILGVSPATLRNWDSTGKLEAKRDPNNNYRLYNISQLERFTTQNNHKKPHLNQKTKLRS